MLLMTYVKAGDDETWPLRQHRQRARSTAIVTNGTGRIRRMLFSNRVRAAIADAADGADGIFQRRAHPDYSITGSAFTPEGNVDPERPKRRLRPTQVTGEGPAKARFRNAAAPLQSAASLEKSRGRPNRADQCPRSRSEGGARRFKQHLFIIGVELPERRGHRRARPANRTDYRRQEGSHCWQRSLARVPRATAL